MSPPAVRLSENDDRKFMDVSLKQRSRSVGLENEDVSLMFNSMGNGL